MVTTQKIAAALIGNSTDTLGAGLHEGGRPQVDEITLPPSKP